jgi:hypothetical protein
LHADADIGASRRRTLSALVERDTKGAAMTPLNHQLVVKFLTVRAQLARTPEADVLILDIAARLGWDYRVTQEFAADLQAHRLIETDAGLGDLPTVVESFW